MIKLKITLRNAQKNGVLTFAKLFGLTLSFAVILFAVSYVYYETSFDKHVPDYERIYRCIMKGKLNNEEADYSVTSAQQAYAMVNEIPEVIEAVRLQHKETVQLGYGEDDLSAWGNLHYTDSNFFSFFGIPIISNYSNPFEAKENIVISKGFAEKLFGNAKEALGKVVSLHSNKCIVTGVFDDLPANSHLLLHFLQSADNMDPEYTSWSSQNVHTYFKTAHEITDHDEFSFKLSKMVYSHNSEGIEDSQNAQSWEDLKYADNMYVFYIHERLTDIRFSNHKFDVARTSNKTYVYGAIILAVLVFLISTINYINLSNASITTRFKEIGIRKTIGAYRKDVVVQFLLETFLFVTVSFIISVLINELSRNWLAQYLGFEISLSRTQIVQLAITIYAAALFCNLILSLVPVRLVISRNLAVHSSRITTYKRNRSNNILILAQFVLSGLIILCTILVQKQIYYFASVDRGYDSENILVMNMWQVDKHKRNSFIKKLRTYPAVKSIGTTDAFLGHDLGMAGAFFETQEPSSFFHPSILACDKEFFEVFNLQLVEGRTFIDDETSDLKTVILNEAAVREYNGEGGIVGKDVILGGNCQVIGIIRDFNFRSLHHVVEPLVITKATDKGNVYLKLSNAEIASFIEILEDEWEQFEIAFPFNYKIHDEVIAERYSKEQEAKKILMLISIISILISCVGLYAVSYFGIVRRTKEIGVRKVNGAKVADVMAILNREVLVLVSVAFIVASPVAWYFIHRWLENFAYRTPLSWWVFILTGIVTLSIALVTVSWQSWRAASRNPVEALRYE